MTGCWIGDLSALVPGGLFPSQAGGETIRPAGLQDINICKGCLEDESYPNCLIDVCFRLMLRLHLSIRVGLTRVPGIGKSMAN